MVRTQNVRLVAAACGTIPVEQASNRLRVLIVETSVTAISIFGRVEIGLA